MTPFGPRGGLNPERRLVPTNGEYVMAARVHGKSPINASEDEGKKADAKDKDKKDGKKDEKKSPKKPEIMINAVVITDIDMLSQDFFRIREQGDASDAGFNFNFDNVTFVLNVLDALANDDRFIDIRKRRPVHHTLARIEEQTKEAKKKAAYEREEFTKEFKVEEKSNSRRCKTKSLRSRTVRTLIRSR